MSRSGIARVIGSGDSGPPRSGTIRLIDGTPFPVPQQHLEALAPRTRIRYFSHSGTEAAARAAPALSPLPSHPTMRPE